MSARSHLSPRYPMTHVQITIKGKRLDHCERRQLVNVHEENHEWDGSKTSDDEIKKKYDEGMLKGVNTDEFVTDTDWDWKTIKDPEEAKYRDKQHHGVKKRREETDESIFTAVQINKQESKFKIEVRCKSTKKPVGNPHEWGYSWSNERTKLTGKPYGSASIDIGKFEKPYGGVEELEKHNQSE